MKKYELDTVGQIYGAIATKTWSPMFRMQATLYEVVSPELLQQAAEDLKKQKKEPIAIGIPVNVREILASKTMRNYSVQKSITLLPEQSNLSIQQKCNLMGKQLKDFLQDKDLVRNMTAAYVASLENPLVIFQRKCAPS